MTDSNGLKPGDIGYESIDSPLIPVEDPEIINKIAAKAIDAPEIISNKGILFLYKL